MKWCIMISVCLIVIGIVSLSSATEFYTTDDTIVCVTLDDLKLIMQLAHDKDDTAIDKMIGRCMSTLPNQRTFIMEVVRAESGAFVKVRGAGSTTGAWTLLRLLKTTP